MTEIVWEDPPPKTKGSRKGVWAGRLAPLREHPGKWANLGSYHCGTAAMLKGGRLGGATAGEFDAVCRDVDRLSGRGTLYVRYVGEAG